MLLVLVGCGGSSGTTTLPPATTQAPPASQAEPSSVPVPTVTPPATTESPTPPPTPTSTVAPATSNSNSDLLAKGKLIFEKTAGGVGCAQCHGIDGRGGGTGGDGAPNIRGATETQVRNTLGGGVPLMSFIKLSDEEIAAVVEYLQYLNKQP